MYNSAYKTNEKLDTCNQKSLENVLKGRMEKRPDIDIRLGE